MDPIRNPYAPGAGQRPPELAGRDEHLDAFEVTLERVSRGRPERSVVLTGLRGVGKTVLLNALRSSAVRAGWGTGKLEARPDTSMRRGLASAVHQAVRELGPSGGIGDAALGVVKAFGMREVGTGKRVRDRWNPGISVPAAVGRADSGDIEIDVLELFSDVGGLGRGVAIFIDEMQDLGPEDVSALCAAAHEISQSRVPLVIVGAGLPHLPAVLSASKSYSERLFRYSRIDRLGFEECSAALAVPAEDEGAQWSPEALTAMYAATYGYPYFIQAVAAPEAERELTVGFFGSRYERATPGERDYLRAMADAATQVPEDEQDAVGSVATADVASALGKKPQSLSPARDALLKKGLIYSGERGKVAFTVPHFGTYLREHA